MRTHHSLATTAAASRSSTVIVQRDMHVVSDGKGSLQNIFFVIVIKISGTLNAPFDPLCMFSRYLFRSLFALLLNQQCEVNDE
jgi:hypothetical protein